MIFYAQRPKLGQSTVERSGRDTDALLRSHGYHIHSRPRRGEVLWEKGGKVINQGDALRRIGEG